MSIVWAIDLEWDKDLAIAQLVGRSNNWVLIQVDKFV